MALALSAVFELGLHHLFDGGRIRATCVSVGNTIQPYTANRDDVHQRTPCSVVAHPVHRRCDGHRKRAQLARWCGSSGGGGVVLMVSHSIPPSRFVLAVRECAPAGFGQVITEVRVICCSTGAALDA
jgi:hypothetical protein